MTENHRIHYLDNLRAIAMLLGLVLHAGVFSGTLVVGPWRLHHSSEFIFWIVAVIHFFRMQLFFLLSGFFSSLVAEKIGIKDFLKSRLVRIFIPFLICVAFLMPLMMAAQYIDLSRTNDSIFTAINKFFFDPLYVFKNKWPLGGWFWHFWFLQFLIAFIFLFVGFRTFILKKPENNLFIKKFIELSSNHIGFWLIVLITYIINLFGPPRFVVPGVGFSINSLIYFGIFFFYGSFVYYKPRFLEISSKKFSVYFLLFIVAAIIIIPLRAKVAFTSGPEIFNQDWSLFQYNTNSVGTFNWSFPIVDNRYNFSNFFLIDQDWHLFSFLRSFTTWSSMFLVIYLFKSIADKKNVLWEYVSQSSYWVYLIHFPIQHIVFVFLLRDNVQSAILLFLLLLVISTFLSFLTYHIFVRKSFIGKVLNGKKYINNSLDLTNFFKKKNLYVISIFVISLAMIALYEKNSNSKILNLALHKDFPELKKIITENEGITLYSKRGDGRTPLHLISTKVNDFSIINTNAIHDSIELILQDGLNVDARDNFGNSPLHYAVRSGNHPAIFGLLRNGANPNIQNIVNDSTPLHNAAAKGDKKILNILLMNQADPNIINKFGKKPIDYYKQFNNTLDNVIIKQLE